MAAQLQGAWLVLTQPEALRGVKRTRNSTKAHLSAGGTERLRLAPAHQRSVLGWVSRRYTPIRSPHVPGQTKYPRA